MQAEAKSAAPVGSARAAPESKAAPAKRKHDELSASKEGDDGDFDADSLNQIQTFIWLQSQPVKHVLRAVKNKTWEDEVLEFSFGLELSDMNDIMSSINEIGDVATTAVDVVEKPEREGAQSEGTPPPNL